MPITELAINISIVNPESVIRVWPYCEGYIRSAVQHARGELGTEDVKLACARGDMHLWVVYNSKADFLGAAVTQCVEYPRFNAMRIVLLGGKRFDEWKAQLNDDLCTAARKVGCARIEAFGRTGFVRSLQGLGYDKLYTAIGKEL